MKIGKENYPESVRRLYIVNTPGLFSIMWKVITPILDPSTLKKTRILGNDFLEILQQEIDLEYIPANLGGKGPTISSGGPYYNPGEQQSTSVVDEWKKVIVPRMGVYECPVEVSERNTIIVWEFQTEDLDIGFGVFYGNEGERIEDLPVKRYDSDKEIIRDLLVASQVGTYVLQWDNTFSWTKRKFMSYRFFLFPPSLLKK
eukprot:TRINITY_DN7380_c0_g1_i1.p1 TRINITY_DN7380_c0_g1~~TRINITY_DN7380_c0_g1_i1.p1  ORF type:complete len:201 (-),score=51.81 TRINITY_DN7380_c0_g1_i1:208-810(-)